jgi:Baculovirus FP protein
LINIEQRQGEVVEDIVLDLAEKLGIALRVDEIEAAHRLPTRQANRPSRIIVQFASRKKRDLFISKKKSVITSQLLIGDSLNSVAGQKRIYINENLIPFYKDLLWRAKERAKEAGYKFVWFKRGKILVKQNEDSTIISINSFADLDKITS